MKRKTFVLLSCNGVTLDCKLPVTECLGITLTVTRGLLKLMPQTAGLKQRTDTVRIVCGGALNVFRTVITTYNKVERIRNDCRNQRQTEATTHAIVYYVGLEKM
jgi:hypothetical protein